VARGAEAIGERIAQLRAEGVGIAIVDAISNDDLLRVGPGSGAGAVKSVQGRLGIEEAGAMVEHTIASIARGLVGLGVRQLVSISLEAPT
jgi:uncharacterized protein YgbK (DUF1537 family)